MIASPTDTHPPADVVLAVGIGQCVISHDRHAVLAAYGLGSCIGIAAWDSSAKVAGLIHILLPEPPPNATGFSLTRFAATGVPYFLRQMEAAGGMRSRLHVAAVGGAQMLNALTAASLVKGIGLRNAAVVSEMLRAEGIPLFTSDFGGSAGRTLTLALATGYMQVRASGGQPREL